MSECGCYQKNKDVVFRKIADEFVLVPIRKSVADLRCVLTLNDVGAFIWEQLDGTKTATDVAAAVCGRFAVSADTALADVTQFLKEMAGEGLVQRHDTAAGT